MEHPAWWGENSGDPNLRGGWGKRNVLIQAWKWKIGEGFLEEASTELAGRDELAMQET